MHASDSSDDHYLTSLSVILSLPNLFKYPLYPTTTAKPSHSNIILPTKSLIANTDLDPTLHPTILISYLPPTTSHASHQLRMKTRPMGSWGVVSAMTSL
jgi:hypothetical protein